MKPPVTILGIETSCDETSAALFSTDKGLLATTLFSQIELHHAFGGVVPEIASRSQLEKIIPIIDSVFKKADITLADIDVIAITNKPGLPGSLLVGVNVAKTIAWAANKKLIGVNHLEGHIFSAYLEHTIPFPHLCLTASGGHTALYLVEDFGKFTLIGQTMDDAAGEAFDKVAKLLGLSYPGGPEIEKRAAAVNFQDFFTYPRGKNELNFSFSGLKTAVLYDLVAKGAYDLAAKKLINQDEALKNQVASSLLVCIGDIFAHKIEYALKEYPHIKALTFVGGVACNRYLKTCIKHIGDKYNIPLFSPSPLYCTDNGAMIAFVGHYKALQHEFSPLTLDILE